MFFFTVFISANIMRIFEMPYYRAQGSDTFDSNFTAIWVTVITMTTIGYGDIAPCTPPGRFFTIMLAFWSSLLLSLLVVCCSTIFEMNDNQKMTLAHLRNTKQAAGTIF